MSKNNRHLKVVPQVSTTEDLEALLSEEIDEDFGFPEFKDAKPVKLKDWKAEDFASIYTRFRPHLERHARKFLSNPSQIDEVVQDAFLYLMVSLPELDSEIGVLKFMKWKVKNLCIDIYRAQGKAFVNSIDEIAEPQSNDPDLTEELEQADDAAVVKLALAKLNPRHREVLIAQIYEEKTIEEIAMQISLSENATRQLTFRARAAFKKALLGDVNTDGMSMTSILSVAAKKAAQEAKKTGVQAMALLLFLVISAASFMNQYSSPTTSTPVAEAPKQNTDVDLPEKEAFTQSLQIRSAVATTAKANSDYIESVNIYDPNVLSENSARFVAASNSDAEIFIFKDLKAGTFTLQAAEGVTATFSYDPSSPSPVKDLTFNLLIDGIQYKAYALNPQITQVNGETQISGQLSDLIDLQDAVFSGNALSGALFTLTFSLNGNTATGHLKIS